MENEPGAEVQSADEQTAETVEDRPESLAEALGEDGPGIASEIESELQAEPTPDGGVDAGEAMGLDSAAPEMAARLGLLNDLEVTVTARLCVTTQPLGAVLSMTPGSVLDLGRSTDAPIELLANGVLVAYGEVVAVGSTLGVRITALPGQ